MPLIEKGFYIRCSEDIPYEVETAYQLKYYVSAALFTIDSILQSNAAIINAFENRVQYYRYYVDNLFYFLGLINDRFVCKNNIKDMELQQKKNERIALNQKDYQFLKFEFKILSNKIPRNIIEHLDERNVKTMMKHRGVGGFNVFFADSDPEMVEEIKANRNLYPYNLDLVGGKVLFYNIQAKPDDVNEFEIDIMDMRAELKKLEENIKQFAGFLEGY